MYAILLAAENVRAKKGGTLEVVFWEMTVKFTEIKIRKV